MEVVDDFVKDLTNPRSAESGKVDLRRRKRIPRKPYQRKTDIYVTKKSNFLGKVSQCEKLLRLEHPEIFLHSIGCAIPRAISLAVTIQQRSPGIYGVEANTGTVDLVDDLVPLTDDQDFELTERKNSSIHIRIFRRTDLTQLESTLKSVIKGRVSF